MEFPDLGKHCSEETCKRLDFLPVKCDACLKIFCGTHMGYVAHNCPLAYKRNNQVPVCPLCNIPIPIPRGTLPDIAVSRHIDNNCQSDRLNGKKKVFTNKCSMKGCHAKELVPVICRDCRQNYCFKHRHTSDHHCTNGRVVSSNSSTQNGVLVSTVHGKLSEDEALARALQLSLNECTSSAARARNNGQNSFSQNCSLC